MENLKHQISGAIPPTANRVAGILSELSLAAPGDFEWRKIGNSRDGLPLYGIKLGSGSLRISITAGAHSDEPAGPMAALDLLRWLTQTSEGKALLRLTHWTIAPHVNPDGAEKNALWHDEEPEFLDYAKSAFRESPGEDIEFGYPTSPSDQDCRPENAAVAAFLRGERPYQLHFSLHGMGFAEGAWWLIGKEWVARTATLRKALRYLFHSRNFALHDIDRRGEKGFSRIAPGFCTTPESSAMQSFFHRQGDPATAALFRLSSMEFVQSLGGEPLVMVSELPIFTLGAGGVMTDPPNENTPFQRFRPRFRQAAARYRETGAPEELLALQEQFAVRAVPFAQQIAVIRDGVLAGVRFLAKGFEK